MGSDPSATETRLKSVDQQDGTTRGHRVLRDSGVWTLRRQLAGSTTISKGRPLPAVPLARHPVTAAGATRARDSAIGYPL